MELDDVRFMMCDFNISGVHERHVEKRTSLVVCFKNDPKKQMDRSLQPELLAKMPSLYESLADALGNARASGEGILRAPQKAGV